MNVPLISMPVCMSALLLALSPASPNANETESEPKNYLPEPTQMVQRMAQDRKLAQWPCLSYTLPCGEIPTRRVETGKFPDMLEGDIERGRKVALEGPCISCHKFNQGVQSGTVGPELSHYGQRGVSDLLTYRLVYDMRIRNPNAVMPPFGTNELLTQQQLRDVVAFLQSLK